MRLFFLQHAETGEYLNRLLVTREGYTLTRNEEEIHFCSCLEDARDTVRRYPELKVMCIEAEPVEVYSSNAETGMSATVPEVSEE